MVVYALLFARLDLTSTIARNLALPVPHHASHAQHTQLASPAIPLSYSTVLASPHVPSLSTASTSNASHVPLPYSANPAQITSIVPLA